MSLRPFKILYTGIWGSGYMKRADNFIRVNIKDITLVVHIDNTFVLTASTVYSDDFSLEPFSLNGQAKVVYESTGEIHEILLSKISYNHCTLEDQTTFSVSKKKCTCLPIPHGEAFFCFSSRLSPVSFTFWPERTVQSTLPNKPVEVDDLDDMSFDEIFEAFSAPETPVDAYWSS